MVKIGIVGGTGYGGVELVRILTGHPKVELTYIGSSSHIDTPYSKIYPSLRGMVDISCERLDVDLIASKCQVIFLSTPHGVAMKMVSDLLKRGLKVIDLSADYRLKDAGTYEAWYGITHTDKANLSKVVYGLPELFREEIKKAKLVANPGCYPTATTLGLLPLLKDQLIDTKQIVVDAKSGVSGAGRRAEVGYSYSEVNDSLKAYGVTTHRHTPEIEQSLSTVTGEKIMIQFTPHLVPMTRGILASLYLNLKERKDAGELLSLFRDYYQGAPFVTILDEGEIPATKNVYGSNYCQIGLVVDKRTQRVIILSVIDNLVKGAAGQAVQNMNLMLGFDEVEGLDFSGIYP